MTDESIRHAEFLTFCANDAMRRRVQFAAAPAYADIADRLKREAESFKAGADALTASCGTCGNWLPWKRGTAKHPCDSTRGDCDYPSLRGRISGFDETFSCALWRKVEESDIKAGRG